MASPKIASNLISPGGESLADICSVDAASLNAISLVIIQSAIEVHRTLGAGLLENIYSKCLSYELLELGHTVRSDYLLPIRYKQVALDGMYKIDLLVDDEIIVELKPVETVLPVHYAQLLTYLRLADKRLGLFINFNVSVIVKGVKRVVNRL